MFFFICVTVSALAVRAPPPSAGRGTGAAALSAQPSHAVTVVCRDGGQAITEIICPRVNLLYPGQAEPQADRDRCAALSTQSHRRGGGFSVRQGTQEKVTLCRDKFDKSFLCSEGGVCAYVCMCCSLHGDLNGPRLTDLTLNPLPFNQEAQNQS